jgi:hypothetical protein
MKPKQTEDVRVLNDGLHSKRTQNAIRKLFTTYDLKNAVLYQFIVSGSQDREEYQASIKALMRHIRTKCRAEYIGAYEVGEEKNGLHTHTFVIIETVKHFPSDLLSVAAGGFIARRIKRTGLSVRIEPPKNRMHGGAMFARMDTPAKLENCINWAGYILKPRSKDDVPGRETYFGSEFTSNIAKREAQRQKHRDALLKTTATPSLFADLQREEATSSKESTHEAITPPQCTGPASTSPKASSSEKATGQGQPIDAAHASSKDSTGSTSEALVRTRPAASSEAAAAARQGNQAGNEQQDRTSGAGPDCQQGEVANSLESIFAPAPKPVSHKFMNNPEATKLPNRGVRQLTIDFPKQKNQTGEDCSDPWADEANTAPATAVGYEGVNYSFHACMRTSEMAYLANASSAVSDSSCPNGASTTPNSYASIALATDRAVGSLKANSMTISRLAVCSASRYVTRNFGIGWESGKRAHRIPESPLHNDTIVKVTTGADVTLSPAERYVCSRYEEAVDAGLDVEALRLYLLAHGIKRTPAMLLHELDNLCEFAGYSASHPAPPKEDVPAFDKLIDSDPDRSSSPKPVRSRTAYDTALVGRKNYLTLAGAG